jgi:hypothetical protein
VRLARPRSILLVAAGTLVLVLGQFGGLVAAATTPAASDTTKNEANGLKVSPLRTDVTLKPGESGLVKVYVTNLTKATVVLKPIENDFVAADEKGTPSLILDENSYAPSHSLKRYMVPLQNVTVGAGQLQEVDVHVTVPKTAQAGGYFGALRFAPASNSNQPIALSSSVASLILLTGSALWPDKRAKGQESRIQP